jgi:hypothetical protein
MSLHLLHLINSPVAAEMRIQSLAAIQFAWLPENPLAFANMN